MDLLPTLISSGWASGVNAWATVLVLGLMGRAGLGSEAVPEQLTETPVLVFAGIMYVVEFVADKVPLFDSAWDVGQTFVRPVIGGWVGYEFAGADGASSVDQAVAAGGTGALALASHASATGAPRRREGPDCGQPRTIQVGEAGGGLAGVAQAPAVRGSANPALVAAGIVIAELTGLCTVNPAIVAVGIRERGTCGAAVPMAGDPAPA